jgi:hypothetical protein
MLVIDYSATFNFFTVNLNGLQGDQIGRIFAIIFFGQLFQI